MQRDARTIRGSGFNISVYADLMEVHLIEN